MEKISKSLYNDTVVVDFYPEKHWYKVNNEFVPSVTSICGVLDKPALLYRAVDCYKKFLQKHENITPEIIERGAKEWRTVSDEAKATGTIVHEWIEEYIKTGKQDIPENEQARQGIIAFLDWKKQYDVEFLENEKFVYSKEHNFVGKFDTIVSVKGKKYLVDFKTSKDFYPMEMGMQLAGYRLAYEEETGNKIDGSFIARLDKETGNFSVHRCNEYERDKNAFLSCRRIHEIKKEIEKQKKDFI